MSFVRPSLVAIATGLVIFQGGPAQAATLAPEKGQVLLNKGDGFQLATGPTEVAVGAQVVANPESKARITFADGCTVDIRPGSVFIVAKQSPCERSGALIETGGSLKDAPRVEEERSLTPVIVMGGAAAAAGAILLLTGKDKGASP